MARRVGTIAVIVGCSLLAASAVRAQGRGNANWTTAGYDAQRSSWLRTDPKISAESLRKPGFQLLWKLGLAGQPTPMIVLDPYTGYRGHKSLGFLSGPSDDIYSIDTDLGLVEWHNHLASGIKPPAKSTPACPGGMTSSLTRPTAVAILAAPAGRGGAVRSGPARGTVGEPNQGVANLLPAPAPAPAPRPVAVPAAPAATVVRPNVVYALTSDGMLQTMYVSNGADAAPPLPFLPPNAHASGLIVVDNVAYVETERTCGGVPNGVWALDLITGQVTSWKSGASDPAFGPDGTLYVTSGNALVALEPKSLQVKSSFRTTEPELVFNSSPVVFRFGDRILVAAATLDGRIFLLDSTDPNVALDKTPAGSNGHGFMPGALTSWQDNAGTRWLLGAGTAAITAWKVADTGAALKLQPGWVSRNMLSPLPPIVVNGVVFAVAAGEYRSPAVLYALDAATGKELWNSGTTITSFVKGGGLSAGSGQIYLGTSDGTLYAFGFPMEH